jgi:hypothetical protein
VTTISITPTQTAHDGNASPAGGTTLAGVGDDKAYPFWYYSLAWQFTPTIPQGATVSSATMTVYANGYKSGTTTETVSVGAENVDNSAVLAGVDQDITHRSLTTVRASWTVTEAQSAPNAQTSTPDLSAVLNAIVQRTGWVSGNRLTIITPLDSAGSNSTPQIFTPKASGSAYPTTLAATYTPAGGGGTPNQGSASGHTAWHGTASGSTNRAGTANGHTTATGNATGTTTRRGTASGATTAHGTAAGSATHRGTANGATASTGTAAGARASAGTATSGATWTASATGNAPVIGAHTGHATGAASWTGTTSGSTSRSGHATGTTLWIATATGNTPTLSAHQGTGAGAATWTGTATGKASHAGQVAAVTHWTGTASGTIHTAGAAVGGFLYVGTASGQMPPPERDITLTIGGLTTRSVAAGPPAARSLTAGNLGTRALTGHLETT